MEEGEKNKNKEEKNEVNQLDNNDKKEETEIKILSLKDILEEKAKANSLLNLKKYSQSESIYKNILESIDNILKNENIEDKKEIIEQKKFIMSNLAFCLKKQYKITESMKYDRIIIKKLDKKFAKSYARLIEGYMENDKLSMARYHYDLMKSNVDEETMNKCSEVINKLKEKLKYKDQEVDNFMMLKNFLKK